MKRSLFVLATVTLSTTLYAQQALTLEQARHIVEDFNPQLLERASQKQEINTLVEEMLSSYLSTQPLDTLANRYTLAALARNFDNSVALNATLYQYKDALLYSKMGGGVEEAAHQAAQTLMRKIVPNIWAVSVQNKQALLAEYQKAYKILKADDIPDEQQKQQLQTLQQAAAALQAELKLLQTHVGQQLVTLTNDTLEQVQQEVAAEWIALQNMQAQQTANLQIKTKHKKPVAE